MSIVDEPRAHRGSDSPDNDAPRRHRWRTRRTDRRLPAREGGPPRDRPRGRGPGRWPGQDGRGPRRLPLRSRRPSLLHEEQGGQRPLARDHGRRVPHAPPHVADLLAQEVPRLPPERDRRHQEARPDRARPLHGVLRGRRPEAEGQGGQPRAVGVQPLRQAALRALLQVLHREGVGRARRRDRRRLGRAAHQGPVLLQRREGRLPRQQGQQDQVAHRRVPVPALRPGPDVGADDRPHRGARRRGASGDAGRPDRDRRRRRGPRDPRRRRGHPARLRHLARCRCARPSRSPTRSPRRRSATPRSACATATS